MYAVVKTGGKQYRVETGQRIDVERLDADGEIALAPVLVVDGGGVLATPDQLSSSSVRARVVGHGRGTKVTGFTYKPKSNQRRSWGHRQDYTTLEITGIEKG
jgi:large subunit ribosomal protein L21